MSASASVSWDNAAQEFGQKVDLTVRLREILRNYPEGLSILKEIIQNSDDAGARTVRFCTAEPRRSKTNNDNNLDVLSNAMKGPSLLAYNSAKFTKTDFQSIQQIGESLKKDAKNKGTKTGRFGVGFNSTYHLTDLPMFVSGTKVVIFDPQAKYVPGINPANPGKMIDYSSNKGKNENGRNLVKSLPFVFDPLKVFGCDLLGLKGDEDFNGTLFRFALRTHEQAKISRLSRQSHSIDKMRDLLKQLASVAPEMLIFLKNVERIEIYDWKSTEEEPTLLHETYITTQKNNHGTLRKKRAFMLNYDPSSNKPTAVDYILDIQSNSSAVQDEGEERKNKTSSSSRWIVCNQLGGGYASVMANDSELSHMKLVPYGGVAARIPCDDSTSSSPFITDGKAYCFLPLPINTELPIHINGYFELSSNRRDVWTYGSDMAGDGKARAKWNESIVQDIAAPSYIRLVQKAIRANLVTPENYESLFPLKTMKNNGDDIWGTLCREFYKGIRDLPVLFSECRAVAADDENGQWVKPSKSILPHNEKDTKLMEILALEKLPLVIPKNKELKENLLKYKTCTITASPANIRKYYSRRKPKNKNNNDTGGSLEHKEKKIEYAQYLLSYCLQDLSKNEYNTELSGCQFIPLANGTLGTFCVLPKYDENALKQLQKMGFAEKLSCIHALRTTGNNVDEAMESLLQKNSSPNNNNNNDDSVPVIGIDPYLICEKDTASLLTPNASNAIVNLDQIKDLNLKLFFRSREAHQQLNILSITPDMLADVVARSIPINWRGNESAPWDPSQKKIKKSNNNNGDDECEYSWPDVQWFVDLWRFILCSSSSNTDFDIIHTIAERYCIVPTQQGIVCTLSPGASVIDFSSNQSHGGVHNQNKHEEENITKILVSLGVRIFHHEVFPKDLVIPKALWSYIFEPTIDGVIKVMDTALRRESSMGRNLLDQAGNETKSELFTYFCNRSQREKISKHCKVMLRNYPIFESYSCDYDGASSSSSSSSHGETKEETRTPQSFVPMKAGKVWYILEDATKEDKAFMKTSDFLVCQNQREVDFLVQLGAKKMSRSNFYKRLVLPSIAGSSVCNEEEIKNAMIAKILLNISSLEIENPGFSEFLSKSKCIPSAMTKTLNAPCDLYDPEVSQLVNLMSDDSFPDEYFTEQPDLLFSLRKLGLQTKLSWDVILDCARSIEKEGTRIISQQQDVDISENGEMEEEYNKLSSAKARGKELLLFLDMYKETYFPEMKKKR